MTINNLMFLLVIYTHGEPHEILQVRFTESEAGKTSISNLLVAGLIEKQNEGYDVTPRGKVYLEYIAKLGLPIQHQEWRMPLGD